MTAAERFAQKYVVSENGCWLWLAASDSHGYGCFRVSTAVLTKAHRWSWEQLNGPVPEGLELDHLCRTPACVNPAHLEAVTHAENMRRSVTPAAANAVKTHCVRGHELTADNVYHPPKRPHQRHCKACKREDDRRYYRERNAA